MKAKTPRMLALVSLILGPATASPGTDTLKIIDLAVPSSPAFIIMNAAPTIIEKPSTPKALALSLASNFSGASLIPENYGLEVTPFWFFRHDDLSPRKYFGINSSHPISAMRLASLSAGIVKQKADTSLNLSLGFRTSLFSLKRKASIHRFDSLDRWHGGLLAESTREKALIPPEPVEERKRKEAVIDSILIHNPQRIKNIGEIADLLNDRPIFNVEFALAGNVRFLDNKFETGERDRTGAWLTVAWSFGDAGPENGYFNVLGVGKFLNVSERPVPNAKDSTFIDLGGKLELESAKLTVGGEYLYRFDDVGGIHSRSRYTLNLNYCPEHNLCVATSAGKTFGEKDNLIAQLVAHFAVRTGKEEVLRRVPGN